MDANIVRTYLEQDQYLCRLKESLERQRRGVIALARRIKKIERRKCRAIRH